MDPDNIFVLKGPETNSPGQKINENMRGSTFEEFVSLARRETGQNEKCQILSNVGL